MNRHPTSAKIVRPQTIEIYDQNGNYLYNVHVGPEQAVSAVVNGESLAVNLVNGHVQVFSLGENCNPVLRYTL